jgi:hypothetical protein
MSAKMANKINALLLKAESTEFPEEAEALTAKAMVLMTEYAISDALLEETKAEKDPRERVETRIVRVPKPYSMDRLKILGGVARAMGGYMYFFPQSRSGWKTATNSKDHSTKAALVGFPSDLDRIWTMFESLIKQEIVARKMAGEGLAFEGQGKKKIWNKSFIRSYGYTIEKRLREIYQEETSQAAAESGSVALVLASRKDAVKAEVEAADLGSSNHNYQSSWAGSAAGREAGSRASLGKEIEGG